MATVAQQMDVIVLLVKNLIESFFNHIEEPQENIIAEEKF